MEREKCSAVSAPFPSKQNRATYVKCKQGQVHTVRILWINFHQCCGNATKQALPANAQFAPGLRKWWQHILSLKEMLQRTNNS